MNNPATTREPDPAAVLVPVFRDRDERLRIVLIRRADRGIHGGQIAFPGGRPERGDGSLIETALRETHEEIGLTADRVEILAHLPRVQTRSSRFDIQPYLGHVQPPARWSLSIDEVAEVLTPTIASLAEPGIRRRSQVLPRGWTEPLHVPVLEPEPNLVIWGATYRILVPLLTPLRHGHWAI